MEFHQLMVSASPGDAVTNAALELRQVLRQVGPSEIYAAYRDPRLADEVQLLGEFPRRGRRAGEDVIVYHASIGEPLTTAFLLERRERVVLVYHNISPAASFAPYDPAFAGLLVQGRRELVALRHRVHLALAVSPYNARDLEALGYEDVRLAPLIIDTEAMRRIEPDPATAHHLQSQLKGPVVLYVGQLSPHKRADLLVQAYHVLVTYLEPEAHLILVGAGKLVPYRQAVQSFIEDLNLSRAWIAGSVAPEALVAFYRRADAFVTASEHEGFCVPVVEAMAFDVPVVARAQAALPETLGGAGLLLPPEDDPVLLAEAMAAAATDPAIRPALVAAGRSRLRDFDPDNARAAVLEHLLEVA